MKRFAVLATLAVIVGLLLAACATPAPQVKEVVKEVAKEVPVQVTKIVETQKIVEVTPTPVFKKVLRVGTMGVGDVPTLDPSLGKDTTSIQCIQETYVGLTRQNEQTAQVEPGMATKWDVSADGKTYTFSLLKDVPWVKYNAASGQVEKVKDADGKERMVTCNDFKYGIMRTLDPKTASDYAYVLTQLLVGGEEYNTADLSKLSEEDIKKLQDGVAVTCIDDATLEMKIKEPASFFPQIAGLWMASAEPQWIIEEKGDRWVEPGFYQSYGPFALKTWNHESDLTLIANPFWPGISSVPKPKLEEVFFTMLDQTPSFANYETGENDFSVVPVTELDRVNADPVLSKELKTLPALSTYYYGFNVTKPPFDDVNVRRAFSWAIDRQALIDNVLKGGQQPARWFTRPGLQAAPDPALGDDFGPPTTADPAKAKEFLAASKYKTADQLPPITLMMNQVESHVKIGEAIQQMWKENLGVNVQLTTQEWKVYLETLEVDSPQVWRLGWNLDYADANNFAKDVFYSTSANNHTHWKNETYDKLVDQAAVETDVKKRHDLYVQSEKILVEEDAAIIPIYWYTTQRMLKPYVVAEVSKTGDFQPFEKWDIQPH